MRLSSIVALVTAALLLAGCAASKLDADATVRVTGTVLDAAGQPARGADVALFKVADIGEVLVGATLAIGTLGASCFVPGGPAFCQDARKTTTDDSGKFSYSLKGSDTQGSVANARDFDLTAFVGRTTGKPQVASVRFKVQRTDLEVPPLRVWDAQATTAAASGGVRTSWPALPADYGESPTYALRFVADNKTVWSVAKAAPGDRVDGRYLEDARGAVEVGASTSRSGPDTKFRYTYFAAGGSFAGTGKPPSRGAACFSATADGAATALSPCRLTDGDLSTAAQFSGDATARPSAYVDLGSSRPVSLVVARGAAGTTEIETSDDAKNWTVLGPGGGSLVSADGRGIRARYVRIRTTNNVDISSLSEISVW